MARQNDALANFGPTTNEELSITAGATAVPAVISDECSPAFLLIQNVGTTPVFYRLANFASGAGACTTTNYTGILAACTADEDGTGGVISFSGYTGGITFRIASGTGKVNVSHSGRLGD